MKMIEDGMYYDNTSLYHEAYKRLRADYIPSATIDIRLRLIPKKIIHNGPATVVIWSDGEKTVVKLMEGDTYDKYAAFTAALAKRIWGSTSRVKRVLKDVTVEQKEKEKEPEFKSWKGWAEHINNFCSTTLWPKHVATKIKTQKLQLL